MQFGVFDQVARSRVSTGETYERIIKVVQHAERAGFYGCHITEHHGSPLSLTPSPSLFLSALAARTSTIRLGPMVYLLPLYDPYRLAQEVCMLDHLSGGRLDLGVGRGGNPFELAFFGLTPDLVRTRFDECFEALMQGLVDGCIRFSGEHYTFNNAPLEDRPLQRPHPPIWYPSNSPHGSIVWAAKRGYHTMVLGPVGACADTVKAFQDNFVAGPHGSAMIGLHLHVYVAETEDEARRVGRKSYFDHQMTLKKLMRDGGFDYNKTGVFPPDELDEAIRGGWAVAGNPAQVREQIQDLCAAIGNNYTVFSPTVSNLATEWGIETIDIFKSEIIPAFN